MVLSGYSLKDFLKYDAILSLFVGISISVGMYIAIPLYKQMHAPSMDASSAKMVFFAIGCFFLLKCFVDTKAISLNTKLVIPCVVLSFPQALYGIYFSWTIIMSIYQKELGDALGFLVMCLFISGSSMGVVVLGCIHCYTVFFETRPPVDNLSE